MWWHGGFIHARENGCCVIMHRLQCKWICSNFPKAAVSPGMAWESNVCWLLLILKERYWINCKTTVTEHFTNSRFLRWTIQNVDGPRHLQTTAYAWIQRVMSTTLFIKDLLVHYWTANVIARKSNQAFHPEGRNPSTWAIICCLPGTLASHWIGSLEELWLELGLQQFYLVPPSLYL